MIAAEQRYQKPKVGELLKTWEGRPCMVEGHNFIVKDIDHTASTWPGQSENVLYWFVLCNQVKRDGLGGKTLRTFLVSTSGSVVPLEGGMV